MDIDATIRLLPSLLPPLRKWIADTLCAAQEVSRPAFAVADDALRACFGRELLENTRVVVTDALPRPPLEEFGFAEFSALMAGPTDGVALGNVYFVRPAANRADLHFHELVHIVQWNRLGTDNMLLAYGTGLATHGYRDSPLESMAYELQREFNSGVRHLRLIQDIERRTDEIWSEARTELQRASVNVTHSIHSDWILGRRN